MNLNFQGKHYNSKYTEICEFWSSNVARRIKIRINKKVDVATCGSRSRKGKLKDR